MYKLFFLLLIVILVGCNFNEKQPFENKESVTQNIQSRQLNGNQIVNKLDSLDFFNLTNQSELEISKNEMVRAKNEFNFFTGTLRGETLVFTDNRFYWIDCEVLFETDGITRYLDRIAPTFKKLNLELEYANEKSRQTKDYWEHTIKVNGKEYIAFDGEFSDNDWGIAYINFISILNDQLKLQKSKNRFYPIKCGNDGEMVLLTKEQFALIKENYPNDREHPKLLLDWKLENGL